MRQVKQVSPSLDRKGYKLVVDLYTGGYAEDIKDENHPGLRYATEVVRVLGSQYSYAYIGVPVNVFGEEHAPAVALARDGPAGKVKLRTRAKVKMVDFDGNEITLLVGYIVQHSHVIDEDSVVSMIFDDRYLLSKLSVFGQGIYDPATGRHWFDAGKPCVFNLDGYPDCCDTSLGPRFCPTKLYGYSRSEVIEDSREPVPGIAPSGTPVRARSWRCQDIVQYLRAMYYSGHRPSHPQDYGNQQLSQYIDWPKSFGNERLFTRVARNFSCENMDMSEALSRICRKAGPYEIQMRPVGWRGQLGLVRIDQRMGGIYLTGPTYGSTAVGGNISDALGDYTRVSGGTIIESCVGYFDDVVIAGDPPALEHEFSMGEVGGPAVDVELEKGWTDEQEANFKAIITANGSNETAFLIACRGEPRVYCCYKVKQNYKSAKQTLFPDFAPPISPRILPRLLSGFAMGNNNPRDFNPREIILEYYDEVIAPFGWKPCARFDNLEIVDDGNAFMVSSLRESGYRVTFRSTAYDANTFVGAQMRLTCAVEREFRITGTAKDDPNNTSARVNAGGERWTFLACASDGDYVHWEREHSRPNGNNCVEPLLSQDFPDKCKGVPTLGEYVFSDLEDKGRIEGGKSRIKIHADHRIKDVKRIDYHGTLAMHTWNPNLNPGQLINLDLTGANSITPQAVIRSVRFNSQSQSQHVELMAGEQTIIYDIPMNVPSQTAGGSPVPASATTPKTAPSTGVDNPAVEQKVYNSKTESAVESSKPAVENSVVSGTNEVQKKTKEQNNEVVTAVSKSIRPPPVKSVTREGNTPYEKHPTIKVDSEMSKIPSTQEEWAAAKKVKDDDRWEMKQATNDALRQSRVDAINSRNSDETE